MSAPNLTGLVAQASPVALADLEARAALLTRRDRKYLVPWLDVQRLVSRLGARYHVLEIDGARAFGYQSVYFDTPDLESYLAAARRRPHRFKVRTRAYLESRTCQLEIKTRSGRGRTVKRRVAHPFADSGRLGGGGLDFVAGCPLIGQTAGELRPVLTTSYRRATLLLDAGARVTIDVDLCSEGPDGRRVALPGTAVVETKSAGAPTEVDHLLWRLGHRPIKVSKFGTSLSVLYPDLPSNKWRRALRWPWVAGPAVSPEARMALAS